MDEMTIAELQQRMAEGELTARTIAELYIDRIERLDQSGPTLNAVIQLNPDALATADALDAERRISGPRGVLHGIPVMLKDNIDTADRMMTTAGSLALLGSIAARDADLVERLRSAGAVILGKTNLSEWANFRSSHSTSGWSSRGGQTRNPYALDRNPSGSSSGSAVAVAANLCAGAIGTETDGSIIGPSHANGIVGMKPTVGLVSRSGIVPIAHSQDTAGPMARTVADAAVLLGGIVGDDPRDPLAEQRAGTRYTRFLDPNGLLGARIGVARDLFGFSEKVDAVVAECVNQMRRMGAILVDPVYMGTARELGEAEFEVLLYEFKADLDTYLAGLGPQVAVHSLDDVIEFNNRDREQVMRWFGQDLMVQAAGKGPLTDEPYLVARERCLRLARDEGIDAAMREHELDAILAPSGGPAHLTDVINGDPREGGFTSTPAAVAGYPNITVPAGYVHGLPVGISFFAGAFQEPRLLRIAYAFEKATQVRRSPEFLSTAVLSAGSCGPRP
jgi:amidase